MTTQRVKVFAPATIANVGPGFDILGVAIAQPGDFVVAEKTIETGLRFSLAEKNNKVPLDNKNVAAFVARLILNECKPKFGVHLTLQKQMPIGSGLGSSGASAAASAFAVNLLLGRPFSKMDLVHFAASGEKLASGTAHADNVAPSLLGGVCLIRSYNPLDVIQLPYKNVFHWIVVHPELVIETRDARAQLPTTLALTEATAQCGNVAALITGLQLGDPRIVANALEDHIAEPVRSKMIPGYAAIKKAALDVGAIGFSISGSGPSVFAIATDEVSATIIGHTIQQAFLEHAKVESQVYHSLINAEGAQVVEDGT